MQRRIETIVFISAIIAVLFFTHLYITFYGPASRGGCCLQTIEVERGAPFRRVAQKLKAKGIIRSERGFLFAAWLKGAERETKAGEYEFSPSMSPLMIIGMLKAGRVKGYTVTIPEGYTVGQIAALLAQRGLADKETFMLRAEDGSLVKALGLPGPGLEGYLFPDTYRLNKGMSVTEIIKVMARRFKDVYGEKFARLAKRRGLSTAEAVTLASIIEKETSDPSERALISSVFHNRLRRGIKLQSDPTVIYAIRAFDGNIRKRDLKIRSPYNTYTHYGLPPGPIANPGEDSISAAISPAKTKYLYFVSKNDGTHYFSESYKEHIKAVTRYQKRRHGRGRGKAD